VSKGSRTLGLRRERAVDEGSAWSNCFLNGREILGLLGSSIAALDCSYRCTTRKRRAHSWVEDDAAIGFGEGRFRLWDGQGWPCFLSADRTAGGKLMRVIRAVESEPDVRGLNLAVAGIQ
jgi:hypothetical protein